MGRDLALELLRKYSRDGRGAISKKTMRFHFSLAIGELARRGYVALNDCGHNIRRAKALLRYRRALQRLLRKTREKDLRREIERELLFTLAILAAIGVLCRDAPEDIRGELVDAVQRFDARFQGCYEYTNTEECVLARMEPMLTGAKNPMAIQQLLRSS